MPSHLWILTIGTADRGHFLCQSVVTAGVTGQQDEGVPQQTVLGSWQQFLVGERIWVATPVVHDGVPVAVGERENS